ncbi:MAG: hypothetical protein LBO81_03800 [Clostridiales Family XIII bacterium]|jgi:hypothetical protein|nr:hypothetical protein [Clostridiales Family XIII bacterium]
MKKSTKVLTAVFVTLAVALYAVIYGVPGMQSMFKKTAVLEYGNLLVYDEAEVCIIRDETLYLSAADGAIEYKVDEGAKVRGGVSLLSITGGEPPVSGDPGNGEESPLARILSTAGAGAEVTPDNVAPFTAMVSYFADGYEKILSPGAIATLTRANVTGAPAESTPLKRTYANQGEPIYKLTDNNLWYMIYWVDRATFREDDPDDPNDGNDGYAGGKSVRVDLGSTEIKAVIDSYASEGTYMKVLLRSDVYYEDMQKYRKMNAKVVFAEYKGLIVDAKDVMERDGAPGVFVRQINGEFKWVPIKYLKSGRDRHVVAEGTFPDASGESVRTVNYYDEILREPASQGFDAGGFDAPPEKQNGVYEALAATRMVVRGRAG